MAITEKPHRMGTTGFPRISPQIITIRLINLWLAKYQNRTNSEYLLSPSGEDNFVDIQWMNR